MQNRRFPRTTAALALSLLTYSTYAHAEGSGLAYAGTGWLLTNDVAGDGEDRWETSSTSLSVAFLTGGDVMPSTPFKAIELRHTTRLASPQWLGWTDRTDRPIGGTMTFGAYTHYATGPIEWAVGADLALIGEQSGLLDVQDAIHDAFDYVKASEFQRENQIEDDTRIAGKIELGLPFKPTNGLAVRPFLEFAAGVEDFGRIGVDIVLGQFGKGSLMARDEVSGFRYAVTPQEADGLSVIAGADYAWVENSVFFPDEFDGSFEQERIRYRLGASYKKGKHEVFFGNTWLSQQVIDAPEAQRIGSLNYSFRF